MSCFEFYHNYSHRFS
ncbi:hypothetical protein [Rivularia sp. UHCC 0363]